MCARTAGGFRQLLPRLPPILALTYCHGNSWLEKFVQGVWELLVRF